MRNFVSLGWLGAGLFALALAGCDARGDAGTKRIILLTNGADPFWDAMRAGMQDAEQRLQAGRRAICRP